MSIFNIVHVFRLGKIKKHNDAIYLYFFFLFSALIFPCLCALAISCLSLKIFFFCNFIFFIIIYESVDWYFSGFDTVRMFISGSWNIILRAAREGLEVLFCVSPNYSCKFLRLQRKIDESNFNIHKRYQNFTNQKIDVSVRFNKTHFKNVSKFINNRSINCRKKREFRFQLKSLI